MVSMTTYVSRDAEIVERHNSCHCLQPDINKLCHQRHSMPILNDTTVVIFYWKRHKTCHFMDTYQDHSSSDC